MNNKFVITILILFAILLSCFGWLFFEFYYIGNLTPYNFETIDKMYVSNDIQYFITADGYGYVSGGWSSTTSKKYMNTENKQLKNTKLSVPIKIFDEKIIHMSPYANGVLMITEQNELYCATNTGIVKLADKIQNATYASNAKHFLVIDTNNNLQAIDESGKLYLLKNNIKQIVSYKDQLFFLDLQGNFSVGILTASQKEISNEELICTNVLSFDVDDASSHYEGEQFVTSDSELNINNALFVVLLQTGEVYCRGVYHPYMDHHNLSGNYPDLVKFSDWTLLGSNISSFSSSAMGTIMIDTQGKTMYFGYDTTRTHWLGFIELNIDLAESAISENSYVCIKLKSGEWLFWGDSWQNQFCGIDQEERVNSSIETDNPAIFDTKKYRVAQ